MARKNYTDEFRQRAVDVYESMPGATLKAIAADPEAKLAELTEMIPLRRFAEPHEIAAGVGFLASEEAAYVTGVVLPIDGGVSM